MLAVSSRAVPLVMALFGAGHQAPGMGLERVAGTLDRAGRPGVAGHRAAAAHRLRADRRRTAAAAAGARADADRGGGRQWAWTFRYPEQGGAETTAVLHLPAGTPVDIVVTSDDVIHAFWVPRLAGKIDAMPGHVNLLRIQADTPGRYEGLCNEFCGLDHAEMRFDVIVHARRGLLHRARACGRHEGATMSAPADPSPKGEPGAAPAPPACPRSGRPGRASSAWPRSTTPSSASA